MRKKKIMTAVWAILLGLLYFSIFGFSGQTGEESGSLSFSVSEKCAEIVNAISGKNWTEQTLHSMALYFEHPIRKLAHFGEYAVMGILVSRMLRPWIVKDPDEKKKKRKWCFLTVLWVFLSAAADEIHQFFVPGRYCSFTDVMIDTAGGFCGMLFCIVLEKIFRRKKPERNFPAIQQRK